MYIDSFNPTTLENFISLVTLHIPSLHPLMWFFYWENGFVWQLLSITFLFCEFLLKCWKPVDLYYRNYFVERALKNSLKLFGFYDVTVSILHVYICLIFTVMLLWRCKYSSCIDEKNKAHICYFILFFF